MTLKQFLEPQIDKKENLISELKRIKQMHVDELESIKKNIYGRCDNIKGLASKYNFDLEIKTMHELEQKTPNGTNNKEEEEKFYSRLGKVKACYENLNPELDPK